MPGGRKSKNTSSAQTALSTRAGGRQSRTERQFRFDESLALFQYMLSLFGKESLDSLCEGMKGEDWEGWDEQNISRHYHF